MAIRKDIIRPIAPISVSTVAVRSVDRVRRVHRASNVPALRAAIMLALPLPLPAAAMCPPEPPPPECAIDSQFLGGRWDMSQLSGSYTLDGAEQFRPFLEEPDFIDNYDTSGTLSAEKLGGSEDNYIDVACDGTVTGRGRERISGNVFKQENIGYPYVECSNGTTPSNMNWSVTIERSYAITGSVSGTGQLDLDYQIEDATLDFNGLMAFSFDCIFISAQRSFNEFDISGGTERVRLSGGYDPDNYRFEPNVAPRGGNYWLDDALHGLALNGDHEFDPETISLDPQYQGLGAIQPPIQAYNHYFVQDAVSVEADLQMIAEPETPIIDAMELQQPSQYLRDVNVETTVRVEIDWRDQTPGQVEFTYGGTMETVAGADTVVWEFDAGEPGDTIQAVAVNDDERSQPYVINTPKVIVPGWAGSAADWTGASGVRYDGQLEWPVSLQTTRTLSTIELFTGLWGISGSATSDFEAVANSNGAPGSGEMETSADFKFADRSASFRMQGPNQTLLACDELTTTGSATATLPAFNWQRTLNPLTAVPGLQTAACGLSGYLCSVVNSVGIKASATASLGGTGNYSGEGPEIRWVGGSLAGTLSGRIGAGAGLPSPLASVASVSLYGGATGCIEIEVAPDFELSKLGGFMEIGADVSFFGLTATANEDWPFGDVCGGGRAPALLGGSPVQGWVPADGQLAMAVTRQDGEPIGIAVWSALPAGQARPAGAIRYRMYRNGSWGAILDLPAPATADFAPSVAFDTEGRAVIVFMRSAATVPQQPGALPAFADSLELQWAAVDIDGVVASGALTANTRNDFGPQLVRDPQGGVQLYWQRASGVEIGGSVAAPVSLHGMRWDASAAVWTNEELVASGLTHTWGWAAAAYSGDVASVVLSLDGDADMATANDRELYLLQRDAGGWGAPQVLTNNGLSDHAAQLVYAASGDASLLWRQGNRVMQLQGDLLGSPTVAFDSADSTRDDGIGEAFAHGRLAGSSDGSLTMLWTEGTRLQQVTRMSSTAPWTLPSEPFASASMETVHALHIDSTDQLIGYALRSFDAAGTPLPLVEPRILGTSGLFRDGFEGPQ